MKFEPLVTVKNNRVYKISNNEELNTTTLTQLNAAALQNVVAPKSELCIITVNHADVELSPGAYNEELLAALRDFLKTMENTGSYALILPKFTKAVTNADEAEAFIAAAVHTARRVKDCTALIGFVLPKELLSNDAKKDLDQNSWTQWFINDMSKKHAHYVYAAKKSDLEEFLLKPSTATHELILL